MVAPRNTSAAGASRTDSGVRRGENHAATRCSLKFTAGHFRRPDAGRDPSSVTRRPRAVPWVVLRAPGMTDRSVSNRRRLKACLLWTDLSLAGGLGGERNVDQPGLTRRLHHMYHRLVR